MDLIEQRTKDEGKPALEIFKQALDNAEKAAELDPLDRRYQILVMILVTKL